MIRFTYLIKMEITQNLNLCKYQDIFKIDHLLSCHQNFDYQLFIK